MGSKKIFLTLFFILIFFGSKSQTDDFELIEVARTGSANTIIYLTAVWCKPCMEKLDTLISVFGKSNNPELIILFDRYGYLKTFDRLKELYDTLLFRTIPQRYYDEKPKGLISVQVNPSKTMMKKLVPEIGDYLLKKLTLDDLWFGQAIYMKNKKLIILKEMEKTKMIPELNLLITAALKYLIIISDVKSTYRKNILGYSSICKTQNNSDTISNIIKILFKKLDFNI
jgi:hypothetical protein